MIKHLTIFLLFCNSIICTGQDNSLPDFSWGNAFYYNLNTGDSIVFNGVSIQLLELDNHYNRIRLGNDTLWLKVSRRTLPVGKKGIRVFIADNKNVKAITDDNAVHGLLTKDVLLCASFFTKKMLDLTRYIFPVSFSDGFMWGAGEDSHMFSYMGKLSATNGEYFYRSFEGIGIDLSDARGIEKHWIVAIENSTVAWIEDKNEDMMGKEACVLLQSDSNPAIFYVYDHLYNKNIEVKPGQKLVKGDLIGTSWGDKEWGHLQLAVIKSDSIPHYNNRFNNAVNFFPQLYELYFQQAFSLNKFYTKGKIEFGKSPSVRRNEKNITAFEDYAGKGWSLGAWNKADKIEWQGRGKEGNARLRKVLFAGTEAQSRNPNGYYDFEVNVKNGVYRVRAKVGDLELPSWQKVEFEGVVAGSYALEAGKYKWTSERVVKVNDYKLTIRIFPDNEKAEVSGLSEIVFQQVY